MHYSRKRSASSASLHAPPHRERLGVKFRGAGPNTALEPTAALSQQFARAEQPSQAIVEDLNRVPSSRGGEMEYNSRGRHGARPRVRGRLQGLHSTLGYLRPLKWFKSRHLGYLNVADTSTMGHSRRFGFVRFR